jgi:hypothetical protein
LQAESAGLGTEYGDQLLEKAITLAGRERIPVADPLREAKAILTDALSHNPQHDDACAARRFAEHNGYLPAGHPAWKSAPPCDCWVSRLASFLKSEQLES